MRREKSVEKKGRKEMEIWRDKSCCERGEIVETPFLKNMHGVKVH
jgi:hypothetical protein